jgi:hypothetical protein
MTTRDGCPVVTMSGRTSQSPEQKVEKPTSARRRRKQQMKRSRASDGPEARTLRPCQKR